MRERFVIVISSDGETRISAPMDATFVWMPLNLRVTRLPRVSTELSVVRFGV